ncbi:hypothetical protein GMLC_18010 [Geomonas limicola]|uniref:Uncharacterized protein n=1 Tax=Geomonas limicola TaxID=2740186 RepID=A0A6V8N6K9_9BACT|nr:hypothetical protein [Geomonas limicola]GFO68222.1 hypothetical protein GMLC_18010 [Geomonas limicola]
MCPQKSTQIKEEIRKADEKRRKLLAQQRELEAEAFSAIGKLIVERPELLTAAGIEAVKELYPDLAEPAAPATPEIREPENPIFKDGAESAFVS